MLGFYLIFEFLQVDLVEMLEENGENMKVIGTISDFCNGTSDENNGKRMRVFVFMIRQLQVRDSRKKFYKQLIAETECIF